MKGSELHNEVLQTLKEFETIDAIEPSFNWDKSLMDRLAVAKPYSSSINSKTTVALVFMFIVLVNLGFILKMAVNNSNKTSHRNSDLQVISKELLINPISTNN